MITIDGITYEAQNFERETQQAAQLLQIWRAEAEQARQKMLQIMYSVRALEAELIAKVQKELAEKQANAQVTP